MSIVLDSIFILSVNYAGAKFCISHEQNLNYANAKQIVVNTKELHEGNNHQYFRKNIYANIPLLLITVSLISKQNLINLEALYFDIISRLFRTVSSCLILPLLSVIPKCPHLHQSNKRTHASGKMLIFLLLMTICIPGISSQKPVLRTISLDSISELAKATSTSQQQPLVSDAQRSQASTVTPPLTITPASVVDTPPKRTVILMSSSNIKRSDTKIESTPVVTFIRASDKGVGSNSAIITSPYKVAIVSNSPQVSDEVSNKISSEFIKKSSSHMSESDLDNTARSDLASSKSLQSIRDTSQVISNNLAPSPSSISGASLDNVITPEVSQSGKLAVTSSTNQNRNSGTAVLESTMMFASTSNVFPTETFASSELPDATSSVSDGMTNIQSTDIFTETNIHSDRTKMPTSATETVSVNSDNFSKIQTISPTYDMRTVFSTISLTNIKLSKTSIETTKQLQLPTITSGVYSDEITTYQMLASHSTLQPEAPVSLQRSSFLFSSAIDALTSLFSPSKIEYTTSSETLSIIAEPIPSISSFQIIETKSDTSLISDSQMTRSLDEMYTSSRESVFARTVYPSTSKISSHSIPVESETVGSSDDSMFISDFTSSFIESPTYNIATTHYGTTMQSVESLRSINLMSSNKEIAERPTETSKAVVYSSTMNILTISLDNPVSSGNDIPFSSHGMLSSRYITKTQNTRTTFDELSSSSFDYTKPSGNRISSTVESLFASNSVLPKPSIRTTQIESNMVTETSLTSNKFDSTSTNNWIQSTVNPLSSKTMLQSSTIGVYTTNSYKDINSGILDTAINSIVLSDSIINYSKSTAELTHMPSIVTNTAEYPSSTTHSVYRTLDVDSTFQIQIDSSELQITTEISTFLIQTDSSKLQIITESSSHLPLKSTQSHTSSSISIEESVIQTSNLDQESSVPIIKSSIVETQVQSTDVMYIRSTKIQTGMVIFHSESHSGADIITSSQALYVSSFVADVSKYTDTEIQSISTTIEQPPFHTGVTWSLSQQYSTPLTETKTPVSDAVSDMSVSTTEFDLVFTKISKSSTNDVYSSVPIALSTTSTWVWAKGSSTLEVSVDHEHSTNLILDSDTARSTTIALSAIRDMSSSVGSTSQLLEVESTNNLVSNSSNVVENTYHYTDTVIISSMDYTSTLNGISETATLSDFILTSEPISTVSSEMTTNINSKILQSTHMAEQESTFSGLSTNAAYFSSIPRESHEISVVYQSSLSSIQSSKLDENSDYTSSGSMIFVSDHAHSTNTDDNFISSHVSESYHGDNDIIKTISAVDGITATRQSSFNLSDSPLQSTDTIVVTSVSLETSFTMISLPFSVSSLQYNVNPSVDSSYILQSSSNIDLVESQSSSRIIALPSTIEESGDDIQSVSVLSISGVSGVSSIVDTPLSSLDVSMFSGVGSTSQLVDVLSSYVTLESEFKPTKTREMSLFTPGTTIVSSLGDKLSTTEIQSSYSDYDRSEENVSIGLFESITDMSTTINIQTTVSILPISTIVVSTSLPEYVESKYFTIETEYLTKTLSEFVPTDKSASMLSSFAYLSTTENWIQSSDDLEGSGEDISTESLVYDSGITSVAYIPSYSTEFSESGTRVSGVMSSSVIVTSEYIGSSVSTVEQEPTILSSIEDVQPTAKRSLTTPSGGTDDISTDISQLQTVITTFIDLPTISPVSVMPSSDMHSTTFKDGQSSLVSIATALVSASSSEIAHTTTLAVSVNLQSTASIDSTNLLTIHESPSNSYRSHGIIATSLFDSGVEHSSIDRFSTLNMIITSDLEPIDINSSTMDSSGDTYSTENDIFASTSITEKPIDSTYIISSSTFDDFGSEYSSGSLLSPSDIISLINTSISNTKMLVTISNTYIPVLSTTAIESSGHELSSNSLILMSYLSSIETTALYTTEVGQSGPTTSEISTPASFVEITSSPNNTEKQSLRSSVVDGTSAESLLLTQTVTSVIDSQISSPDVPLYSGDGSTSKLLDVVSSYVMSETEYLSPTATEFTSYDAGTTLLSSFDYSSTAIDTSTEQTVNYSDSLDTAMHTTMLHTTSLNAQSVMVSTDLFHKESSIFNTTLYASLPSSDLVYTSSDIIASSVEITSLYLESGLSTSTDFENAIMKVFQSSSDKNVISSSVIDRSGLHSSPESLLLPTDISSILNKPNNTTSIGGLQSSLGIPFEKSSAVDTLAMWSTTENLIFVSESTSTIDIYNSVTNVPRISTHSVTDKSLTAYSSDNSGYPMSSSIPIPTSSINMTVAQSSSEIQIGTSSIEEGSGDEFSSNDLIFTSGVSRAIYNSVSSIYVTQQSSEIPGFSSSEADGSGIYSSFDSLIFTMDTSSIRDELISSTYMEETQINSKMTFFSSSIFHESVIEHSSGSLRFTAAVSSNIDMPISSTSVIEVYSSPEATTLGTNTVEQSKVDYSSESGLFDSNVTSVVPFPISTESMLFTPATTSGLDISVTTEVVIPGSRSKDAVFSSSVQDVSSVEVSSKSLIFSPEFTSVVDIPPSSTEGMFLRSSSEMSMLSSDIMDGSDLKVSPESSVLTSEFSRVSDIPFSSTERVFLRSSSEIFKHSSSVIDGSGIEVSSISLIFTSGFANTLTISLGSTDDVFLQSSSEIPIHSSSVIDGSGIEVSSESLVFTSGFTSAAVTHPSSTLDVFLTSSLEILVQSSSVTDESDGNIPSESFIISSQISSADTIALSSSLVDGTVTITSMLDMEMSSSTIVVPTSNTDKEILSSSFADGSGYTSVLYVPISSTNINEFQSSSEVTMSSSMVVVPTSSTDIEMLSSNIAEGSGIITSYGILTSEYTNVSYIPISSTNVIEFQSSSDVETISTSVVDGSGDEFSSESLLLVSTISSTIDIPYSSLDVPVSSGFGSTSQLVDLSSSYFVSDFDYLTITTTELSSYDAGTELLSTPNYVSSLTEKTPDQTILISEHFTSALQTSIVYTETFTTEHYTPSIEIPVSSSSELDNSGFEVSTESSIITSGFTSLVNNSYSSTEVVFLRSSSEIQFYSSMEIDGSGVDMPSESLKFTSGFTSEVASQASSTKSVFFQSSSEIPLIRSSAISGIEGSSKSLTWSSGFTSGVSGPQSSTEVLFRGSSSKIPVFSSSEIDGSGIEILSGSLIFTSGFTSAVDIHPTSTEDVFLRSSSEIPWLSSIVDGSGAEISSESFIWTVGLTTDIDVPSSSTKIVFLSSSSQIPGLSSSEIHGSGVEMSSESLIFTSGFSYAVTVTPSSTEGMFLQSSSEIPMRSSSVIDGSGTEVSYESLVFTLGFSSPVTVPLSSTEDMFLRSSSETPMLSSIVIDGSGTDMPFESSVFSPGFTSEVDIHTSSTDDAFFQSSSEIPLLSSSATSGIEIISGSFILNSGYTSIFDVPSSSTEGVFLRSSVGMSVLSSSVIDGSVVDVSSESLIFTSGFTSEIDIYLSSTEGVSLRTSSKIIVPSSSVIEGSSINIPSESTLLSSQISNAETIAMSSSLVDGAVTITSLVDIEMSSSMVVVPTSSTDVEMLSSSFAEGSGVITAPGILTSEYTSVSYIPISSTNVIEFQSSSDVETISTSVVDGSGDEFSSDSLLLVSTISSTIDIPYSSPDVLVSSGVGSTSQLIDVVSSYSIQETEYLTTMTTELSSYDAGTELLSTLDYIASTEKTPDQTISFDTQFTSTIATSIVQTEISTTELYASSTEIFESSSSIASDGFVTPRQTTIPLSKLFSSTIKFDSYTSAKFLSSVEYTPTVVPSDFMTSALGTDISSISDSQFMSHFTQLSTTWINSIENSMTTMEVSSKVESTMATQSHVYSSNIAESKSDVEFTVVLSSDESNKYISQISQTVVASTDMYSTSLLFTSALESEGIVTSEIATSSSYALESITMTGSHTRTTNISATSVLSTNTTSNVQLPISSSFTSTSSLPYTMLSSDTASMIMPISSSGHFSLPDTSMLTYSTYLQDSPIVGSSLLFSTSEMYSPSDEVITLSELLTSTQYVPETSINSASIIETSLHTSSSDVISNTKTSLQQSMIPQTSKPPNTSTTIMSSTANGTESSTISTSDTLSSTTYEITPSETFTLPDLTTLLTSLPVDSTSALILPTSLIIPETSTTPFTTSTLQTISTSPTTNMTSTVIEPSFPSTVNVSLTTSTSIEPSLSATFSPSASTSTTIEPSLFPNITTTPIPITTPTLQPPDNDDLVEMLIKPNFGDDSSDPDYKSSIESGLLTAFLIGQQRENNARRRKRQVLEPPNPDNVTMEVTELAPRANETVDVIFYGRYGNGTIIPGTIVIDTLNELSMEELSAYLGAQVLEPPHAFDTVYQPITDQPDESLAWLVIVIILSILVAILLCSVLFLTWRKCRKRPAIHDVEMESDTKVLVPFTFMDGSSHYIKDMGTLISMPTKKRKKKKKLKLPPVKTSRPIPFLDSNRISPHFPTESTKQDKSSLYSSKLPLTTLEDEMFRNSRPKRRTRETKTESPEARIRREWSDKVARQKKEKEKQVKQKRKEEERRSRSLQKYGVLPDGGRPTTPQVVEYRNLGYEYDDDIEMPSDIRQYSRPPKSIDPDSLSIPERSLEVQPRDRIPSKQKRVYFGEEYQSAEEDKGPLFHDNLEDLDSDSSMDSNSSAGQFEPVSKMGHFAESLQPKPVTTFTTPPVRFRSSVQPLAEVSSLAAMTQSSLGVVQPSTSQETASPAVKIRQDPLIGKTPRDDAVSLADHANSERRRNKERQRELQSQSSMESGMDQVGLHSDTNSRGSRRHRRRKSRRRKHDVDPEAWRKAQGELEQMEPRLLESPVSSSAGARLLQEARQNRWKRPSTRASSVCSDDSFDGRKVGRNMRAAPKLRSQTPSEISSISRSSYSRAQAGRDKELLARMKHEQERYEHQQEVQKTAQSLINEAYLQQKVNSRKKKKEKRDKENKHAQELLDNAYPLSRSKPRYGTYHSDVETPRDSDTARTRSSNRDSISVATEPTNTEANAAIEFLLRHGSLSHITPPSRKGSRSHSKRSRSHDRSHRKSPKDQRQAWEKMLPEGAKDLSKDDRKALLKALQDELESLDSAR